MTFSSAVAIALFLGVTIILGITVIGYMSSLVRSAYEIKVTMREDLDEGLNRLETEITRQAKWARGEILGEVEKSRTQLMADLEQRQKAGGEALSADLEARAAAWAAERQTLNDTIARLGARLSALESRGRPRAPAEEKPPAPAEAADEPEAKS